MKKIIIVFAVLFLTSCVPGPDSNITSNYSSGSCSSVQDTPWENSYQKYLESEVPKYLYKKDINGDSIPELFLSWGTSYRVAVTYANNSTIELIHNWFSSIGCAMYLSKLENQIITVEKGGHTVGTERFERYSVYSITNGKFVMQHECKAEVADNSEIIYNIEGTNAEKEDFDNMCIEIMKNAIEIPLVEK